MKYQEAQSQYRLEKYRFLEQKQYNGEDPAGRYRDYYELSGGIHKFVMYYDNQEVVRVEVQATNPQRTFDVTIIDDYLAED